MDTDLDARMGGAAGTNLQSNNCPSSGAGGTAACSASYLDIHLTAQSTAYLEVRITQRCVKIWIALIWSNQGTWVWTADHDMDSSSQSQISIYAGRGILSESKGPVWLIGTCMALFRRFVSRKLIFPLSSMYEFPIMQVSWPEVTFFFLAEHHVEYQYNIVNAANHYMGLIQTETVRQFHHFAFLHWLNFSVLLSAVLPAEPRSSFAFQHQHNSQWSNAILWHAICMGSFHQKLSKHPCLWRWFI